MKKIRIILSTLLLLTTLGLQANTIRIKASVDSTQVLFSTQLNLIYELEQAKNVEVILPVFKDTISKSIDVVEVFPIDTINIDEDKIKVIQQVRIQLFDTGLVSIPQQLFKLRYNDIVDSVYSKAIDVTVFNPFKEIDETKLADIKPVYEAPVSLKEVAPYILGLIIIASLVFFVIYYINYLAKKRRERIEDEIKEPAHIIAFRTLERIKQDEEWKDEAKNKSFFIDLSDAVRTYINHRFAINAMEYTTMETMNEFKQRKGLVEEKNLEQLKKMLELSDLVKFAKFKANEDESERALTQAFLFVRDTMVFETATNSKEDKPTQVDN